MWYHYRQNNSGGYWHSPAIEVIIEADNAAKANAIAQSHGLYFDGDGDCPCCGNRWSEAYGKPDAENLEDLTVYRFSFTERTASMSGIALAMILDKSGEVQKFYSFDSLSKVINVTKF